MKFSPELSETRLQAVIFDVDGTLADTERNGHRVAFNQAFKEFQLDWHWSSEAYGEWLAVAGGKERIRFYLQRHAPELLRQNDPEAWIARLHQRKSEIYSERVQAGAISLRPGVARLIRELKENGIRLAIATTTSRSSLDSLITANFHCASATLFEVIGAGDVFTHKKPAPDVYQWVLHQLQLPPTACLAIEDSSLGCLAARAADLPTLITINAYTAGDVFKDALSIVSDLGEPHAAARHLGGCPLAGRCVDVAQLRTWHQSSQTRPASF